MHQKTCNRVLVYTKQSHFEDQLLWQSHFSFRPACTDVGRSESCCSTHARTHSRLLGRPRLTTTSQTTRRRDRRALRSPHDESTRPTEGGIRESCVGSSSSATTAEMRVSVCACVGATGELSEREREGGGLLGGSQCVCIPLGIHA